MLPVPGLRNLVHLAIESTVMGRMDKFGSSSRIRLFRHSVLTRPCFISPQSPLVCPVDPFLSFSCSCANGLMFGLLVCKSFGTLAASRSLARDFERRFWNQICRVLGRTSGPSFFASASRVGPSGFLFFSYDLIRISNCSFVGLNLGSLSSCPFPVRKPVLICGNIPRLRRLSISILMPIPPSIFPDPN